MLKKTPFLQFVAPRILKAHARLAQQTWGRASDRLSVWQGPCGHAHVTAEAASGGTFEPVETWPLAWGRKFQQQWWRIKVPAGDGRWLDWRDQGEATVYRKSGASWVPWHGIDPGHKYALLPDGDGEFLVESCCLRTGIWVSGEAQGISDAGSVFQGAFVRTRDEAAWQAWHDLDVLIDVCRLLAEGRKPMPANPQEADLFNPGQYRTPLEVVSPLLRMLLSRLDEAVDALDREGASACGEKTRKILADFPAESWQPSATMTGHAHIDLVWLWPERAGDFKAVHTFANACRLIEQYPELRFGYSQPASYEAVERRSPALMEEVRRHVGAGSWEPTGVMYVESDTQLACGEGLVRSVLLGQAGFRALTGRDSTVLWLPDVFGYSAAVPQILAGAGVTNFFTTKLHWGGATKFPYSSFRWVGHDGSEIVSHIAWEHYNLRATPGELKWASDNNRQVHVFPDSLVATGFGDGGGGPNASMCERARRLKSLATMPRVRWGGIEDYFDRLAAVKEELPSWHGEMYLEFHRGVQTTHSNLKEAYRGAERGLQILEAARCVAGGGPVDEMAWKRLVFAQFHDYLPGSSVQEVYDEGVPELRGIADRALREASQTLGGGEGGGDDSTCLFNPLAVETSVVVGGRVCRLAPLTAADPRTLPGGDAKAVGFEGGMLSNGRVEATLTEDGRIGGLRIDGRDVAMAGPGAGLVYFPDHPAIYDAWDLERPTLSLGESDVGEVTREAGGDGTLRTVAYARRVGRESHATVRYVLEAGSPLLRIEVELDWRDPQALLKLVFPTAYAGATARYGAPFGSTARTQRANTATDDARFENPASRWAAVTDDGESHGLLLLAEARYGFGCRDGLLHASVVRSAKVTHAEETPGLRDYDAYGGTGHQAFSDLGRHVARFAVGAFRPDAQRHEQAAALADAAFTRPVACARPHEAPGLRGLHTVDGVDSLVPAWCKPLEGGAWVLRLHETLGRRGRVRIDLAGGWGVTRVHLNDAPAARNGDGPTEFAYGPYELLSLRIGR